jgi:biopolymer transport protein ExbD
MTYVGARSAMPVHLPSAQTARPVNERVVLTLLPGRATQVNGNATVLNQLGAAIKQAAKGNLDTQVVVVADEKVPYAQLIAVLDSVRLAKFNRIALAANPKKINESAADFTRAVE